MDAWPGIGAGQLLHENRLPPWPPQDLDPRVGSDVTLENMDDAIAEFQQRYRRVNTEQFKSIGLKGFRKDLERRLSSVVENPALTAEGELEDWVKRTLQHLKDPDDRLVAYLFAESIRNQIRSWSGKVIARMRSESGVQMAREILSEMQQELATSIDQWQRIDSQVEELKTLFAEENELVDSLRVFLTELPPALVKRIKLAADKNHTLLKSVLHSRPKTWLDAIEVMSKIAQKLESKLSGQDRIRQIVDLPRQPAAEVRREWLCPTPPRFEPWFQEFGNCLKVAGDLYESELQLEHQHARIVATLLSWARKVSDDSRIANMVEIAVKRRDIDNVARICEIRRRYHEGDATREQCEQELKSCLVEFQPVDLVDQELPL